MTKDTCTGPANPRRGRASEIAATFHPAVFGRRTRVTRGQADAPRRQAGVRMRSGLERPGRPRTPVAAPIALADPELVGPPAPPPLRHPMGRRERRGRPCAAGEAPLDLEVAVPGGQYLQPDVATREVHRATRPDATEIGLAEAAGLRVAAGPVRALEIHAGPVARAVRRDRQPEADIVVQAREHDGLVARRSHPAVHRELG